MDTPADFSVEEEGARVRLTGDWTLAAMGDAAARLRAATQRLGQPAYDLAGIGRLDTAGAYQMLRATDGGVLAAQHGARPETSQILDLVGRASEAERVRPRSPWSVNEMMGRLGRSIVTGSTDFVDTMAFNGKLLAVAWRTLLHPSRLRVAPLVSLMERAGLDAIPIVFVTNLFVGAVVGLLAANILADFGAAVFSVETVGIGILREFNIVITAVLLAGRSASSFAAEIGAMKMQQEIDAMRVMGVDPFEALVLPRFLALLILTPLLTFIASLAGLAGGCLSLWATIDLSPQFFMQRIVENVGAQQFWVGVSKAPIMAIVIAAIGTRQGMETGGDVESLGRRVTAAVVHAVFAIIFIDAVFALVFMELDI